MSAGVAAIVFRGVLSVGDVLRVKNKEMLLVRILCVWIVGLGFRNVISVTGLTVTDMPIGAANFQGLQGLCVMLVI